MKNKEYIVDRNEDLIKYLISKKISKNKVKSLIKYNCIYINNKLVNKLPFKLNKDDKLEIKYNYNLNTKLNIVFEDKNYLVVDKEASLLTISTSKVNKKYEDTLYKRVREYLNNKKEYAFIVNRIDKETSGLVIFVKNEKLKNKLQDNWNNIVKERKYIAVVSGKIKKDGRIDNYLYEDKLTFSHSTKIGGKRAITNYHVIKNTNKYTLLDINIETGRKNQIRVHMSESGYPIIGDRKYGSRNNPIKRLGLHAYKLKMMTYIL